jgi:hypothetical protein
MSGYIFEGKYKNKETQIRVKLLLIHFIDENEVHFIYSPHLDLTGYGYNFNEARNSFEIVFHDFIEHTIEKKSLDKVLSGLGWSIKQNQHNFKKIMAPSITSVIGKNKHVSDIFDNYAVNTFHEEIGIPTAV